MKYSQNKWALPAYTGWVQISFSIPVFCEVIPGAILLQSPPEAGRLSELNTNTGL